MSIESRLEKLKVYCETYWDLIPDEHLKTFEIKSWDQLPLGLRKRDDYYTILLHLRKMRIQWEHEEFAWMWTKYGALFRSEMTRRQQRIDRYQWDHNTGRRSVIWKGDK